MSTSFRSIRQYLINTVKTSTLIDPSQVFDHEPRDKFSGYPAVTVTPSEEQVSFADTVRNQLHFMFVIKIYQERTETTAGAAEDFVIDLVDQLTALLDADMQLSGSLEGLGYQRPVQTKWSYISSPDVEVRMAAITVDVVAVQ
jgi:hypothetical protein